MLIKNLELKIRNFGKSGQSIVELVIAFGLAAILLPAILTGIIASREGKAQQRQRLQALSILKETEEATRSVRQKGWVAFAVNGTYHPTISNSSWTLTSGIATTSSGFTQSVTISNVSRDVNGTIVSSGGSVDPSTKMIYTKVSWGSPISSFVDSTSYLTRYLDNNSCLDTTQAEFNRGTLTNTQTTNTSGGEVILGNNNKAKWCSPAISAATIDLPDGPPVSVAATASAVSTAIPNQVFVATSPYATSSVKLAYITVTANTDPPVPTLQGIWTLDPTKYSAGTFPSNINFDNSFITNKVAYYKPANGKVYALLATNKPDHEVVVVQINDGTSDSFQDPVNKIYKYWTFFNTRIYQGNATSTPNQDQSPYGYGASSLAVLGSRGYMVSGGFLYVFDLSNIDSKTPLSGLDMVGCRIELDGYDCNPSTSRIRKYPAGSTGTSFSAESAGQTGCMDGGAVQPYADNDIYPVAVGANTYIYVAVGAGTDPELDIANVTSVPTSSTTPRISSSTCGTISSGNSGWKRSSSLDFNSASGTQETANSVFAKSDGTRAYIASNGGVDANGNGQPDADQFYVIDTTTKTAPKFLSGTAATGAQSGYYNGDATNIQMFPRRSLTVLNGQRAVIVGHDGFPNDSTEPQEYQVIKIDNEASPSYCGGLYYLAGFNDLTAVTEADYDTFVYLVANTNEKQLKIIQGGPDGTYMDSGTYESYTCASNYSTAFNRISSSISQPANTSVKMQVATSDAVNGSCSSASYNYVGPDGTNSTYFTPQSSSISGSIPFVTNGSYSNPGQCFRYKLYMTTTDYNATPVVNDVTTNYSP